MSDDVRIDSPGKSFGFTHPSMECGTGRLGYIGVVSGVVGIYSQMYIHVSIHLHPNEHSPLIVLLDITSIIFTQMITTRL